MSEYVPEYEEMIERRKGWITKYEEMLIAYKDDVNPNRLLLIQEMIIKTKEQIRDIEKIIEERDNA